MNYITSNHHTLIWLWFTFYTFTILLFLPLPWKSQAESVSVEATNDKALQFASRLIVRTLFIFPMLFLLKNAI